jgi:hypothetical protein
MRTWVLKPLLQLSVWSLPASLQHQSPPGFRIKVVEHRAIGPGSPHQQRRASVLLRSEQEEQQQEAGVHPEPCRSLEQQSAMILCL